jgi:F-type H+-transporting ATPase subunit delta
MSIETISRRYGSALADVVQKSGETELVRTELVQWATMLDSNADLLDVFGNPSIAHGRKEDVLEKLIEKTRPAKTTANFLRILLRNGRLTELAQINERFAAELEERSGIVSAEIISAHDLRDDERSAIRTRLEKLTGKRVNLNFDIDEELIGGIVTRLGSTVYDGSVRTRLENLKEQLVNG